jgi:hypothetical protein
MPVGRRDFLKLGTAAAMALTNKMRSGAATSSRLPSIPTLDDLASSPMTYIYTDLFNVPIAMNDWGYTQAAKSVSAISAIAFPPYACCGIPDIPWSPGLLITCELFLNDRLLATWKAPGNEITYTWYPHCVVRTQTADGIRFRTTLFMPADRRAAAELIEVENTGSSQREITLGFDMRAAVTKKTTAWLNNLPGEGDNTSTWDAENSRLTYQAKHSAAASAQGIFPKAHRLEGGRMLVYHVTLAPGEKRRFQYVNAIAESGLAANQLYANAQSNFSTALNQNEAAFERLIASAFTPGNSDFSGHLPQVVTEDETLWNLYHNGFKNLLTARRRSPDSAYGPTLLTLSGHVLPTLSFPWDTALSGLSLALLDPQPLRNLVEIWFQQDMHKHLATDYISGQAVGPWYGVNDMAIIGCARDYLRVTGDFPWLDKKISDKSVIDHLSDHALYWKQLQTKNRGLGDYGTIENLLEVVSTYLHEVAGMNAGNVSSMRFLATLQEKRGNAQQAKQLRAEATALAERINRLLYVQGKGWWRCGQPDGTFNEVRHCYDFLAVLDNMGDDLSPEQKKEMADFFWEQLGTKKWMRALSSGDPDASWNPRPDHSCLGAYTAWPPMCAKGLYKTDAPEKILPWLREIARAGNQGPIGQAHFVEDVHPPFKGGAFKASEDAPYIEDWCAISGGAFTNMVIDTIFGANHTLYEGLSASPKLDGFDTNARLDHLHYQGGEYTVSGKGVVKTS